MASTTAAPVSLRSSTVPLLMLVVACGHFNRIGITVAGAERIIPDSHYGISSKDMGQIYSAFLLLYTAAMIPGGWFIDRFGARTSLILLGLGSTVFVTLTGVVGLADQRVVSVWFGLLIARSLLGMVNAPLHPASARMVFSNVPAQSRAFANGLVTFAACVGMAVAYYAMGKLIDRFDWPVAFLITGALTLLVTLVWTAGTRRSSDDATSEEIEARPAFDLRAMLPILRSRSIVCITLSYGAYGYFQYLFFYWIGYYFETIQHQERSVARGYNSAITLAMGVGMASGGWLADHVPKSFSPKTRRILVPTCGMLLSGLVFELGLLSPDARTTVIAFMISAALVGVCEGVFWTSVVELGGRFGGTAAGLMNAGGNAGGTLSPYLTPLLGTLFAQSYGPDLGWRLSLATAGAIVIVGAGLWLGVAPAAEKDRPASDGW